MIEVLVALFIFSVAVMALMQSQSASIHQATSIKSKAYAQIIAENQLTRLASQATSPNLGFQTLSDQFKQQDFIVRTHVANSGIGSSQKLTITVFDARSNQQLAEISGFRRGPQ